MLVDNRLLLLRDFGSNAVIFMNVCYYYRCHGRVYHLVLRDFGLYVIIL